MRALIFFAVFLFGVGGASADTLETGAVKYIRAYYAADAAGIENCIRDHFVMWTVGAVTVINDYALRDRALVRSIDTRKESWEYHGATMNLIVARVTVQRKDNITSETIYFYYDEFMHFGKRFTRVTLPESLQDKMEGQSPVIEH